MGIVGIFEEAMMEAIKYLSITENNNIIDFSKIPLDWRIEKED